MVARAHSNAVYMFLVITVFQMAFLSPLPTARFSPQSLRCNLETCSWIGVKRVVVKPSRPTLLKRDLTMVDPEIIAESKPAFSAKGMIVEDFFQRSIGDWRSQRSSHNLAWTQFEQITSEIVIRKLDKQDVDVIKLCERNQIAVSDIMFCFKMSWEGESDWDDEISEGESVMAVIKDGDDYGRLLRSVGYAETVPAIGKWEMSNEGVFMLNTFYGAAAAEERIWFATPDLRLRVSQIRTSSGRGVVTASFSSEIRRLHLD